MSYTRSSSRSSLSHSSTDVTSNSDERADDFCRTRLYHRRLIQFAHPRRGKMLVCSVRLPAHIQTVGFIVRRRFARVCRWMNNMRRGRLAARRRRRWSGNCRVSRERNCSDSHERSESRSPIRVRFNSAATQVSRSEQPPLPNTRPNRSARNRPAVCRRDSKA